jgi:peptidoglycan biosynthesis protein MviN/MurJ (putative lipid II flippase)
MIWLVGPMGVDGLALALSISAILEVIGLIWALHRRIESVDEGAVLRSTARSGISALAAALLMLGGVVVVEQWFGAILANGIGRLLVLALLSVAGVAIYLLVAAALRSTELDQVRSQLLGRLRRRRAA